MSWKHRDDWVALVDYLLHDPLAYGAYNATAPQPVRNSDFSQQLAQQLHRPLLLPMPAALLNLLLGEMAELVLGSQRVLPQRLLDAGFSFGYPSLDQALAHALP
jgi:NAD dependent epimerase/dehydratase family enzyme